MPTVFSQGRWSIDEEFVLVQPQPEKRITAASSLIADVKLLQDELFLNGRASLKESYNV